MSKQYLSAAAIGASLVFVGPAALAQTDSGADTGMATPYADSTPGVEASAAAPTAPAGTSPDGDHGAPTASDASAAAAPSDAASEADTPAPYTTIALADEVPATPVAEAPPADEPITTVVVTARKRSERLQDVPVAVTALSGQMLEEKQITQAKDIAAFTPGLNITSDSVSRSFIDIRGVGTTLIDTVQPGVGIFLDGVYQPNTSYLNTPLVDVERIEVLRGPQGTLFGQNTLGGAVNIITRQPTDSFTGKLSGSIAGTDDYKQIAGNVSGPIVPGVLRARLGASYQKQDGFLTNSNVGGDANPLEQKAVNGALMYEPLDWARFTLSGYYNRVFGASTPYAWVDGPTDYSNQVPTNENSLLTLAYSGGNLKSEFDLESIASTLTVLGAYDHRTSEGTGDGDFGPYDLLRVTKANGDFNTTTGEVRLDTHYSDTLSSLFGVFGNHNLNKIDGTTQVVVPLVTLDTYSRIETKVYAVYGTLFWNPTPTTELATGLRYDHQRVVATGSSEGEIGASEWEPRITFKKNWTPDAMTYASVARGFRGGGANPPGAPNPTYQGDSVWTYEIGSKLSFLDRRLSVDVAAFYNDYSHYIGQNALALSGSGPVAINLNTGKVHSPGAELQVQGYLTRAWTVNAGVTYLHTRVVDGSEYEETTGKPLPSDKILFLADWTGFVDTAYAFNVFDDKLIFDVSATYKGARNGSTSDPNSVPRLEAYTLLNANITYRAANWEIALWGTNLTDEKYFSTYIDRSILEQIGFVGPLASNLGIIGDGRRIGVRVGTYF